MLSRGVVWIVCVLGSLGVAPCFVWGQNEPREIVLETLRQFRPLTPLQTIRAIDNLLNVGEMELAKSYVREFLKNPPAEPALVALHEEIGSTFFAKIAIDRRLAPDGQALAKLVLSAAQRAARDPKQLQQWAADLDSDKYDTRRTALANLQNAGPDGTIVALQRAADPQHQPASQPLTDAILSLSRTSAGPLWGALRCEDTILRWHAISALARQPGGNSLGLLRWALDPQADPSLQQLATRGYQTTHGSLPDLDKATALLREEAESLLNGTKHLGDIDTTRWTVWYWTPSTHLVDTKEFPRRTAEMIVASQVGEDLLRLNSNHETHHEIYWTAVLAATQGTHGYRQPLAKSAPSIVTNACQCPVSRMESVLRRGLANGLTPAAVAACEILELGTEAPSIGTGSAVAAALRHPNRRVRYAAARLVMHWAPTQAYAAASDVWEETLRCLQPGTGRTVLILDSAPQRGEALAALCREFDLHPTVVMTGQEAIRQLQSSNAIEVILMHEEQSTPTWSETWQQLQVMPTAAEIPTALLYGVDELRESDSERVAIEQLGSELIRYPLPANASSLGTLIRRMLGTVEAPLTNAERMEMAQGAMTWVQKVAADPRQHAIYDLGRLLDLLEPTARIPELAEGTIKALELLPGDRSQRILLTLASDATLPADVRQRAEQGLRASVIRNGAQVSDRRLNELVAP